MKLKKEVNYWLSQSIECMKQPLLWKKSDKRPKKTYNRNSLNTSNQKMLWLTQPKQIWSMPFFCLTRVLSMELLNMKSTKNNEIDDLSHKETFNQIIRGWRCSKGCNEWKTMNVVDGKWIVAFNFLPKASIVELKKISKNLISLMNDIFLKNMVIEFTWNHQILCFFPRNKINFLHNIFPNFLGLQCHELLAQHQLYAINAYIEYLLVLQIQYCTQAFVYEVFLLI